MNQVYRGIEEHIPQLRRYARVLAHNATAADDLLQECVTRALAKSHLYKPDTNLRAWLFTILHNEHVSSVRRTSQSAIHVDVDDAAPALARKPTQEQFMLVRALEHALMTLPRSQRSLIMDVARDGLSYEQAARRRNLPVGTVKSRVSRGRRTLRGMLAHGSSRRVPSASQEARRVATARARSSRR